MMPAEKEWPHTRDIATATAATLQAHLSSCQGKSEAVMALLTKMETEFKTAVKEIEGRIDKKINKLFTILWTAAGAVILLLVAAAGYFYQQSVQANSDRITKNAQAIEELKR